jgi:serine/threonine protein kinase
VVLKVYKKDDLKSYFKEIAVFKAIHSVKADTKNMQRPADLEGFPEMISKKESNNQAEILMESLGSNLRKILKQCAEKEFSKTTVYMIIIQLVSTTVHFLLVFFQIKRLRVLHHCGFVHNDLKLDNIIVGQHDPNIIYLIDFGLSCKFLDETGNHIKKDYIEKFSGNFLFASLNSCRGNNKSRRDDIQSLMYIMVYLLNKNYLPWCDFHKKFKNKNFEIKDFLRERLEIKYTKEVFRMIPKELREIFKQVFTMQFHDEPPYEAIIHALKIEITKCVQLGQDMQPIPHQFEWIK